MRHDNSSKQTLKASDLPPDIPAITFASDLAHIVESYRPGNHDLGDIPDDIPVFNRQTGKIKRFLKKRSRSLHRKRVTSMPIIKVNDRDVEVVKELPQVPPKPARVEDRRTVSMNNQFPLDYTNYHYNSVLSAYGGSEAEAEEAEAEEAETDSIEFKQPKYIVVDDEGDESSVFSNPASSVYSSHSSNLSSGSNSESIIAKSILDVVHGYTSPTIMSDKSSILSRNFDMDNIYASPISDIGLSSHDEIGSFVDSLFSDLSNVKHGEFEIPPPPPPHTVPIITPTTSYIDTPRTPSTPPTPNLDSFPSSAPHKQLPKIPSYTPQLRVHKSRQSNTTAASPDQNSISNTVHSSVSIKDDPKADIKAYVRQRPFSYSLDGPKQYKLSRFPSIATPKKTSRLPSTPVNLPKVEHGQRRIMSEQISSHTNYQSPSIQMEMKPKPRNISESQTTKQDVIKNHIHQFIMHEKRKEMVTGKNLPRVPSERENRFGIRGLHR